MGRAFSILSTSRARLFQLTFATTACVAGLFASLPIATAQAAGTPIREKILLTEHTSLKADEWLVRKVDLLGNIYPFNWPYKIEAFPDGSRFVVIAVEVPRETKVQTVSPGVWDPKKHIALSMINRRDHAISFDLEGKATKEASASLVVQLLPEQTLRYIDPRCEKAGIGIYGPKKLNEYLFIHIQCAPKADGTVRVAIATPPDETKFIAGAGLTGLKQNAEIALFDVSPPKKFTEQERNGLALGSFRIQGAYNPSINDEFEIRFKPETEKWNFQAALSSTYLGYTEPTNSGREISQLGFTGKFIFDYRVKPDTFHFGGNVWGTLIPIALSRTPENTPTTRYLGASLRGMYLIPATFNPIGARWSVSLGWYAWSMLGQDEYGVSLLSGPQVVIGASRKFGDGKKWSSYVKFAPISKALGEFSTDSYEIATGGGYSFLAKNREYTIVLDLARVSATDGVGRLALTTVNLGLQIPLPWKKMEGPAKAAQPAVTPIPLEPAPGPKRSAKVPGSKAP